jgi:hypothetical protein
LKKLSGGHPAQCQDFQGKAGNPGGCQAQEGGRIFRLTPRIITEF